MPDLVMGVLDMASVLGLDAPTLQQQDLIEDWMLDAQGDVEDYLNRPIFPFEVTRDDAWKVAGRDDLDWRAWPWVLDEYDDEYRVVSASANGDGTWTVTLSVGLDGPNTRGIVTYVKEAVRERARHDAAFPTIERVVSSVSAEGQSLSYADKGSAAKGDPGGVRGLDTLRRHRRFSAKRARTRTAI